MSTTSKPLTLYKFGEGFGLPDLSPFVVKLETYLRFTAIPYEVKPGDPRKAPKKKLPYVVDDGVSLADTRLIIEHLETKRGASLDARLTPKERAVSVAFQSMLDEHFYWVLVYERWTSEANWERFLLPYVKQMAGKGGVPGPMTGFVAGIVRKGMLKQLHAQGTGRFTSAELVPVGERIVAALAEQIGDGPFVFGAEPAIVDASAYAFLSGLLDPPLESAVKDAASRRSNLRAYVDRIKDRYWRS